MKHSIKRLPDGELEVMQALWDCPIPASRAEIEAVLLPIHEIAPTTLLTVLSRLAEKDFLSVQKDGRRKLYTPLISKSDYLAELPLQSVTGRYDFTPRARSYEDSSEHLSFQITDSEQTIQLTLSALGLEVYPQNLTSSYLLEEEIDWAYLESLLGPSGQGY